MSPIDIVSGCTYHDSSVATPTGPNEIDSQYVNMIVMSQSRGGQAWAMSVDTVYQHSLGSSYMWSCHVVHYLILLICYIAPL